ncbi:dienelactone hydrolase family protein [Paraburkholderia megapolitana]|uniref:Dienelactone hydrolase n=1 Tax=Paraburkholderia megapolitana TaxID=420953 RepID=A0A1I3FU89_9BURK|nr:CocE/NonD family hydrolase [Paraburkholderia megapolitana]QDQ82552.1 prolyl oligopeptidase family serine peptidase [Paraburkholderia megapolitana]SFI14745.1 Dienelactone hydrolase [Paraburkholderia megapolitana]
MAFRRVQAGCKAVCACAALVALTASSAHADPLFASSTNAPVKPDKPVNSASAQQPVGPLSSAQVQRLSLEDDAWLPSARLNQQILRIPTDSSGDITLETTVYKPDGAGPFPMIVFNHGKMPGDPRNQARSDPLPFAREFVRRGYVVVAPNRRGFAESGGVYEQDGCDVERNGIGQAADVAATIDYMSKQPYVDAQHIVVAGTSHGGLATIAYGAQAASGVRALINFSGGLRQDACNDWQGNLTQAFGAYGEKTHVPSLWLYGDNDSIWPAALITKMYTTYTTALGPDVRHGVGSTMIDFGTYKDDAHRLVGDRDGVRVWWPAVESFLARVGMPTSVQYRVEEAPEPKPTGFASVEAIDAVPFVDEGGRAGYRNFLHQYPSRAFAVSNSGAWSWAEGGDDPKAVAISNCQKHSNDPCRLYAVNDVVVWKDTSATASDPGAVDPAVHKPALASR